MQLIARFRIDDFARALASEATGNAANGCTGRHADRTAHGACCRADGRARTGTNALGEVVLGQLVTGFRVDYFAHALARQAAGNAADGRASDGADGTGRRTNGRARHGAARGAQARADDVLTGVVGEAALDVQGIVVRTRVHAHQDAAALDAFFIVHHALFRNAGADQRANEATGQAAGTSASEGCRDRAGNDQANAWQDQGGADGSDAGQDGADGAANAGANASAFGSLAAQFSVGIAKVILAGVVRHHQGDVVTRIAAVSHGVVGALCAVAVTEQASHHAGIFARSRSRIVVTHVKFLSNY